MKIKKVATVISQNWNFDSLSYHYKVHFSFNSWATTLCESSQLFFFSHIIELAFPKIMDSLIDI